MTGTSSSKKTLWPVTRRILLRTFLAFAGALCLTILALHLFLKSPYAVTTVSSILTKQLGTSAHVSSLALSGTGITLSTIRIMSPAGHPQQPMISIQSLTVTPRWISLLHGQRRFTDITISSPAIALQQNATGEWNISPVIAKLSKQKSTQETIIDRFVIRDASLTTPVTKIAPLALEVNNLATKGSSDSSFIADFQDVAGNPYRIVGDATLSASPAVKVLLTSDHFTAKGIVPAGKQLPPVVQSATARLRLESTLAKGLISSDLHLQVSIPRQEKGWPENTLVANINAAGTFLPARGAATIERLSLAIGKQLMITSTANVMLTGGDKRFTLRLSAGTAHLEEIMNLAAFSPRQQNPSATGTVHWSDLVVSGDNRSGITSCSGTVALDQGSFAVGKRQVLSRLMVTSQLQKQGGSITLIGKATQKGAASLVGDLNIPFTARFSPHVAFESAQSKDFAVTAAGIPLTGNLLWQAGHASLFALNCRTAPFSLNAAAQRFGVPATFDRGTASLQLTAQGTSPRTSQGNFTAKLAGVTGKIGSIPMESITANMSSHFVVSEQSPRLTGDLRVTSGSISHTNVSASLPFIFSKNTAEIKDAEARAGELHIKLPRIAAQRTGVPGPAGDNTWAVDISGLALKWRDFSADAIQAPIKVALGNPTVGTPVRVSGTIIIPRLAYREKEAGSLNNSLTLSGFGLSLATTGTLCGGTVNVNLTSAPQGKAPYALSAVIKQADVAAIAQMLPATLPLSPSGGKADISASGTLFPDKRTALAIQASLTDGSLQKNTGRTLVTGVQAALSTRFAGGDLTIASASLSTLQGPRITGEGVIHEATGSARSGEVRFSLPPVPVSNLLDTMANSLPPALQEATAGGTISGDMRLHVKGRPAKIDGKISIAGGSLEIPSQKLTVSGVQGTIPLVADLTVGAFKKKPAEIPFTRDNHARLVADLRSPRTAKDQVTIDSIAMGPLEAKATRIRFTSSPEALYIPWFRTNLYNGAIVGQGFISTAGGLQYGADLLVDELSLKAFSNSYPSIQGYIQGLVDGIVSLYGKGAGKDDLTGLVRLWTKEGKNEPMLVSKEFLQKVAGKKLRGFFFRDDRSYDRGEIGATIERGYITFQTLDLSHTNFFGVRDISISVAPVQNRIALDHLLSSIRQAAQRGKAATTPAGGEAPPAEFKWEQ